MSSNSPTPAETENKINRIAKVYLFVLLCGLSVFAQSTTPAPALPDAPSVVKHENPFKPDWSLYPAIGFYTVSVAVDVNFVQSCERTHQCIEANPGKDRWSGRWPEVVLIGGATYGCQLMLSEHRRWRKLCVLGAVGWGMYQIIDGTKIHYE